MCGRYYIKPAKNSWKNIKDCLLIGVVNVCGKAKGGQDGWKDHYQRVLNVEFSWDKNSINNIVAVEGPAIFATKVMVTDAITKK